MTAPFPYEPGSLGSFLATVDLAFRAKTASEAGVALAVTAEEFTFIQGIIENWDGLSAAEKLLWKGALSNFPVDPYGVPVVVIS